MEAPSSQHTQIIEISGELPDTGRKICKEATCEFSDAGSISKDSEERSTAMRKLLIAVSLCVIFMVVEVVGGIKANSLAILTDAAHLLSDVAAFAISLFSIWAGGWEPNPRQSFGFFRIEILGALVSMQLIWLLAGILVYEAIARLIAGPQNVDGFLMFVVAAFGLVVNIIMAFVLGHDHGHGHGHGHDHHHGRSHAISVSTNRYVKHTNDEHHHTDGDHTHHHDEEKHSKDKHHHTHEDHVQSHNHDVHRDVTVPLLGESKAIPEKTKKQNINVHGAYLHVLGDSIQSVGVMIGGAIIWYKPEWKIVDLICTLIFSVIVLFTTINMLRNILEVLMESTPREIDSTRLQKGLLEMEEVVAVHELHIWAITVGKVLLACHVKINPEADADMMLDKVIDYIKSVHSISHVTIQIER
jgi:zinc transporter 2